MPQFLLCTWAAPTLFQRDPMPLQFPSLCGTGLAHRGWGREEDCVLSLRLQMPFASGEPNELFAVVVLVWLGFYFMMLQKPEAFSRNHAASFDLPQAGHM